MTITKEIARKMAKSLRIVYEQWEIDPYQNIFVNGICYAVHEMPGFIAYGHGSNYKVVSSLLCEVQEGFNTYLDRQTGGNWTDRATMCLLMAEWLETEILGRQTK